MLSAAITVAAQLGNRRQDAVEEVCRKTDVFRT